MRKSRESGHGKPGDSPRDRNAELLATSEIVAIRCPDVAEVKTRLLKAVDMAMVQMRSRQTSRG